MPKSLVDISLQSLIVVGHWALEYSLWNTDGLEILLGYIVNESGTFRDTII